LVGPSSPIVSRSRRHILKVAGVKESAVEQLRRKSLEDLSAMEERLKQQLRTRR